MQKRYSISVFSDNNADKKKVYDIVEKISADKVLFSIESWDNPNEGQEGGGVAIDYDLFKDSYYDELLEALKAAKPYNFPVDMSLFYHEIPEEDPDPDADYEEVSVRKDDI